MKVSKRVYWVLILSIGIVGCSKFNTNNVEQNSEVKNSEIKEVEVETILDSVKVSYIEDNSGNSCGYKSREQSGS